MDKYYHQPVLTNQVIKYLACRDNSKKFIDCTVGGGGHAWRILEKSSPDGKLLGIDLDVNAINYSVDLLKKKFAKERFKIVKGNFADLEAIAKENNFSKVDGILFDLGVSSYQLDKSDLGISFQRPAPLDMRLGAKGIKAQSIVNNYKEKELVKIFRIFGEEVFAVRIAKEICKQRKTKEIKNTIELAEIVKKAIPRKYWPTKIHPATKVFQALRITVNDELNNLRLGLGGALKILKTKGRLVVISFHSLEDRIVKQFFKINAQECTCPKEIPLCVCEHKKQVRILTKKPVRPTDTEIKRNPRARSAKLRAIEKV